MAGSGCQRHRKREAVWREIDPLFRAGETVLDLGCGTGADAVHLMADGVQVYGTDASAEMVRIARRKGVDAYRFPIESLAQLPHRALNPMSRFEDQLAAIAGLGQTNNRLRPFRGHA